MSRLRYMIETAVCFIAAELAVAASLLFAINLVKGYFTR